ncbi:MAG: DUF2934 domain-containing protein [Paludibaculum sp.]
MRNTLSQQLADLDELTPDPMDRDIASLVSGVSIIPDDAPSRSCSHDEIAALAYQLWNDRGCPIGSPEEDWSRAEGWLRSKEQLKSQAARA